MAEGPLLAGATTENSIFISGLLAQVQAFKGE
jgi:hypothetical protein